ncbi:MAG: ATP-binding protein [Verrucomicrobiota bacterium]
MSFFQRLFLSYTTIVLVIAGVISLVSISSLKSEAERRILSESEKDTRAAALADFEDLEILDSEYLNEQINDEVLEQETYAIVKNVSLAAGVSILGCLILGWIFAKRLTDPFAEIDAGCRKILLGDLNYQIMLPRVDSAGRVAETINKMTQDISKRIEQSSQQRNRMELILQSLQDAVLMIDRQGAIMFFNSAAGEYLDMYDNSWPFTLEKHVKLDVLKKEVIRQMQGSHSSRMVLSWEGESSDKRFAELFTEPLDAANHDTDGLLCVIRDQTQERRFEDLRRAFASNVSHELKTPIAAIGALLETIETYPKMAIDKRTHFNQRIRHQNDRMLRLVNELLALSKLESGSEILDLASCDLGEIFHSVQNTFMTLAEKRNIELVFTYNPAADLSLIADAKALEIIFNSLIDNALRHGPREGWVRLDARRFEEVIEIEISDNGPGIPPDSQPRIFERFYRVEESRSRDRGGSGMGLAIVKHLVQAHKGSIDLRSSNRAGTVFRIFLPANLNEVTEVDS